MEAKATTMPAEWVQWIQTCYDQQTDFVKMQQILLEQFDAALVEQWIQHIWHSAPPPENTVYDSEFSWMPRDLTSVDDVRVEYLNLKPVVAVLHNVLTQAECAEIIAHYRQHPDIARATVHSHEAHADGKHNVISDARTNSLMALGYNSHPLVVKLEHTLAKVTTVPVSQGESPQLLYYTQGQQYTPHDDFFHDRSAGTHIAQHGQRIATVITYLNTVPVGGGTGFPNLDITVPAVAGTAVYFEYTDPTGASTTQCRHAGLPVAVGEKWAITKWLRLRNTMPAETARLYQEEQQP